jgi:ABC-type transport system involved in cytochrome bd biosynthesis fused ATPase/permease subunit
MLAGMAYHRPIPESRSRKDETVGGLKMFAEAEKMMHFAFVMPSAVFIGWLAGAWADEHLHQKWMTITGILLGCVSGLVYVIQQAVLGERLSRKVEATEAARVAAEAAKNAPAEAKNLPAEAKNQGTDTFES